MTLLKTTCLSILLITLATMAFAAPPKTISYQGYLKDGAGAPVSSTAKPMGFALYSSQTGTTQLWAESQNVKVDKGIYNVELGTTNPIALPFDTRYYLGVTVPPDQEMTPRQALTNAPYAFRAGCNPGDMITCYTGPSGTLNVGVCKSGTRTCASDGSSFGPCTGEIIPTQEICYNLLDEDCDGKLDNGCTPRFCEPGTTVDCYSGPPGTQGVGSCHSGLKTCSNDGSVYGPCFGEQGPSNEICDGVDNNCNGIVDEGISYQAVSNGQFACINGAATLLCNTGFAGCLASGVCDTNISNSVQNCGGCGITCAAVLNGTPACINSNCTIAACNSGFADCDGNAGNGCETNLSNSTANCGQCGKACTPGQTCQSGACLSPQGTACTLNSQCSSGICVDNVCCNVSCSGTCQACNLAGQVGTCSNIPNGTDPGNECADQGAALCGTSGTCNGAGACAFYPNGTLSVPASCSGSTLTLASTCNGAGVSTPGGTSSCSPYNCLNASNCRTNCSSSADCVGGFYCNENSSCTPKLSQGVPCASDIECMSGICSELLCL